MDLVTTLINKIKRLNAANPHSKIVPPVINLKEVITRPFFSGYEFIDVYESLTAVENYEALLELEEYANSNQALTC